MPALTGGQPHAEQHPLDALSGLWVKVATAEARTDVHSSRSQHELPSAPEPLRCRYPLSGAAATAKRWHSWHGDVKAATSAEQPAGTSRESNGHRSGGSDRPPPRLEGTAGGAQREGHGGMVCAGSQVG